MQKRCQLSTIKQCFESFDGNKLYRDKTDELYLGKQQNINYMFKIIMKAIFDKMKTAINQFGALRQLQIRRTFCSAKVVNLMGKESFYNLIKTKKHQRASHGTKVRMLYYDLGVMGSKRGTASLHIGVRPCIFDPVPCSSGSIMH